MLMDSFREQKYWKECCEVEISNYKWVLVCSSIWGCSIGRLILFSWLHQAVWCIAHFTAPGWRCGWACWVGHGTCTAVMAFWATWLPIWPWLGINNTVQMRLIDFRCQGLNHKTWKVYILRKVFFWRQMILGDFSFSSVCFWLADSLSKALVVVLGLFSNWLLRWLLTGGDHVPCFPSRPPLSSVWSWAFQLPPLQSSMHFLIYLIS